MPLSEISSIVRCQDDPQKFQIEFFHQHTRSYLTTQRDPILTIILSNCRILRADIIIRSVPTSKASLISDLTDEERDELSKMYFLD